METEKSKVQVECTLAHLFFFLLLLLPATGLVILRGCVELAGIFPYQAINCSLHYLVSFLCFFIQNLLLFLTPLPSFVVLPEGNDIVYKKAQINQSTTNYKEIYIELLIDLLHYQHLITSGHWLYM